MILTTRCCGNFDCSVIKNCTGNISHCIVAGKPFANRTYGNTIRPIEMTLSHFECWIWAHEVNLCPTVGCYSVHNHSNYKTFCCAGDLCNTPQNLTCEVKNNEITFPHDIFPNERSTTPPKPSQVSVTYIVIVVVISLVVCAVVIMRLTYNMKFSYIRRILFKRPAMMNGVSYVSDMTTLISKVTNDNYSDSQRHEFCNEVLKASQLYEKCEKKFVGKFGEIWTGKPKCEFSEGVIENVAIKIFRPRDESSWETEIEMYRFIRNRCNRILTYVGCDKIINYNQIEELWLVTQYIDHGSLYDYLSNASNVRPKWSQVLRICLDIAGGLSYLHEDGSYQTSPHNCGKPSIAHRDLKSRNILIKGDWRACIADLGLAISFHGNPSPDDLHLQVGTQRYMAPEVLEGAINFSRDSFLGIDVYAMALILWEIFSQCTDFEEQQGSPATEVPKYLQPFELELGSHITMESLQAWVVNENKRPQMPQQYVGFEDGLTLWKTIVECWDRDAEARLSSSCVYERFLILNQKFAELPLLRDFNPEPVVCIKPLL